MAVRRRSTRGVVGGRRRAPTTWSRTVSIGQLTVPAATKILAIVFTLNNPGIGETVRRTRGSFFVHSDQAAALEVQLGAFGMVVVSDLALAAGAASIPGPGTDAADDGWFVWQGFTKRQQSSTFPSTQDQVVFDSKAMRRIEEGFGVAVMIENVHPAFGMVVAFELSMLTSLS